MKKFCFTIFTVFFSLLLTAQTVTINGTIKNSAAVKLTLALQKGSEMQVIDSVVTDTKGNFSFTLKAGYKQGVYKLWHLKENVAQFIVGKESKLTVNAELAELDKGEIHIISSKENDAFAVLTNFFKLYRNEIDSLQFISNRLEKFDPKYETSNKQLKTAYSNSIIRFNNSIRLIPSMFSGTFTSEVLVPLYLVPDRIEMEIGKNFDTDEAFEHAHFFDYVNFSDPRIVNTQTYEMKLYTYLDLYVDHTEKGFKKGVDNIMVNARKNTEIRDFTVAFLLDVFTKKGPPALVEYVHDSYSEGCELPMKSETEKLLNKLKQVATGSPAPELLINDINSEPLSLRNTLNGKVGLIYFWASTCSHCMEHTPKVFDLYKKYKNKGFEVYAVSLDGDYSPWLKAIQDMKIEWINVSELKGWSSACIDTYALERTPTLFLVDKVGNIVEKNFSPNELEERLKKYLQ